MVIKIELKVDAEMLKRLEEFEAKIPRLVDDHVRSMAAEIEAEHHLVEIGGIPASARAYLLYALLKQRKQL